MSEKTHGFLDLLLKVVIAGVAGLWAFGTYFPSVERATRTSIATAYFDATKPYREAQLSACLDAGRAASIIATRDINFSYGDRNAENTAAAQDRWKAERAESRQKFFELLHGHLGAFFPPEHDVSRAARAVAACLTSDCRNDVPKSQALTEALASACRTWVDQQKREVEERFAH